MISTPATSRYPAKLIALHWLTFTLVVAAYALAELKGFTARGSEMRIAMLALHYLTGMLIFALTWLRLALRLTVVVADAQPVPTRAMLWAASCLHVFLYAILFALPVLGWLALSAKAQPVHLFFFDMPFAPVELDPAWAKPLREWHGRIANVGYALIGLHAASALLHHYVLRDNALLRMLPQMRHKHPESGND